MIERKQKFYNLDAIISVGYHVKSHVATKFRIWATERLREYIQKGFTMDDERLKQAGSGSYWKELLERIRDIRSSEKMFYRQILDIYATSIDYNPKADESLVFFKKVQNKIHYTIHGQQVAVYLNSSLNHLYWSIGNCILPEMKYEVYSDNVKQIVATLSQQLNKKGVNQ